MATFKSVIRKKSANGIHRVYIRCTHNRQIDYIKTDFYVDNKYVDGNSVTDNIVLGNCAIKIRDYITKLNMEETGDWSVKEVIDFITTGNNKISFTKFCDDYIDKMINDGREKASRNYRCAINSFMETAGKDIAFQDVTSKLIKKWIDTLTHTSRAKEMYPTLLKTMFEAGKDEYNDYDKDIIKIHNQPFKTIKIPKADMPKKRAINAEIVQKLMEAKPDTERSKLAQDVAKLIIYLVGINTVDLFENEDTTMKKGKLCYKRWKEKKVRTDEAYIEIKIRPEIKPLFEKYKGVDGKLFNFGYKNYENFNSNVNKGLKRLCEVAGVKKITTYALRHTWATIARNKCGASTSLVAFCLNHASEHKVTERYLIKDYTPIDEQNNKVLAYIFDTPDKDKPKKVKAK